MVKAIGIGEGSIRHTQPLRDFVLDGEDGYDTPNLMINKLVEYIGLTDAEIDKYFSRWR